MSSIKFQLVPTKRSPGPKRRLRSARPHLRAFLELSGGKRKHLGSLTLPVVASAGIGPFLTTCEARIKQVIHDNAAVMALLGCIWDRTQEKRNLGRPQADVPTHTRKTGAKNTESRKAHRMGKRGGKGSATETSFDERMLC